MVLSTLLAYIALYIGLLAAYIWAVFYLARQADEKGATHAPAAQTAAIKTPLGA
jgi:cytochrome d ubiquinol oxidase subunit I